jgi:hypothetical protein
MSVGFTFLFTICIRQKTGELTPECRRGQDGRLNSRLERSRSAPGEDTIKSYEL